MIECKLVHMFIHCNLWLVSLLNAESLSVSFLYDWIVTTFSCEKLLLILIEVTTYIGFKTITAINRQQIAIRFEFRIYTPWKYLLLDLIQNKPLFDILCLSNRNTCLEHFQQVQLRLNVWEKEHHSFLRA